MKIEYLIKGEESKKILEALQLPEGVTMRIGKFGKKSDSLCVATFTTKSESLANARILSELHEAIIASNNVRILKDGASKRFCESLYKPLSSFERGLRNALSIAICAIGDDFDNPFITDLEQKDFGEIFEHLFVDKEFNAFLKSHVNKGKGGLHEKADLLREIEKMDERSKWNQLFQKDDMATLRIHHNEIHTIRNDVMHAHTVNSAEYDRAMALLEKANNEINEYLDKTSKDINYPEETVATIKHAARSIRSDYDEALKDLFDLSESMKYFTLSQKGIEPVGLSALREQQRRINESELVKWKAFKLKMSDISPVTAAIEKLSALSDSATKLSTDASDAMRTIIELYDTKEITESITASIPTPSIGKAFSLNLGYNTEIDDDSEATDAQDDENEDGELTD